MSTLELKSRLYRLIDSFDDEQDLQDLYDAIEDFQEVRGLPKMGDTSPERIAVLQRALERAESGTGITTEQLIEQIKQWRSR